MIPVLGDIGKAGKWSVKVGREVGEEAVERAGRRAGREIAEAGAERAGREAAEAGGERAGREVAEAGGRAERQEAKAAAKAEKEEAAGAAKQKGSKKEKKKGEKGKWGCRDVRCNVYPDPQADPQNPNCPKRVIGATPYIHPSYNVACVAAQKDANDKVPRGCIKRHCNCRTKCTKK